MGRSQETYNKKEVRNKKEKKRKDKALKRLAKKENKQKPSLDDMIAYVDENGVITSTPSEHRKKEVKIEDVIIGTAKRVEENIDTIRNGTLSYFNESKGYGFIKDSETKESIFVHINSFLDDIIEGNMVSYKVEMGKKGLTAIEVRQLK